MIVAAVSEECTKRTQPRPQVFARDVCLHLPDNSRFVSQHALAAQPTTPAAIFLDRDGVIVEDVHFLRRPSQLRLLPGVTQALCTLQNQFYMVVVTNQSGIARGLFTERDLLVIHTKLVQRLAARGALVDALYYCPHLPEAAVQTYQVACNCRKPKPGLLLRAKQDWDLDLSQSFIIGDMPRDIEAGIAAGVKGILVGDESQALVGGYTFAPDLTQATHIILAQDQL